MGVNAVMISGHGCSLCQMSATTIWPKGLGKLGLFFGPFSFRTTQHSTMDAATAPPPLADDNAIFLNSTVNSVYELIVAIPGSHLILTYVKNAYQDDPFRIILELFLVFFALKYMLSKKYKPQDNAVKLTEKVSDENSIIATRY